jgi:hypothetical protein
MNSDLLNSVKESLKELKISEQDLKKGEYEHYTLKFMQQALNYIYYEKEGKNKDIEINNRHDLNKIDSKDISDAIELRYSLEDKRPEMIEGIWDCNIASPYMIQQDFSNLKEEKIIYTSVKSQVYSWVLAVTGHAANGHGNFKDDHFKPLKFPSTTVNDILKALSKHDDISKFVNDGLIPTKDYFDPKNFRKEVQHDLDNFVELIESYFNQTDNENIFTIGKGMDLLGLKFNKSYKIDMLEFLRGFTLAGCMDSANLRSKAKEKYGWEMGYGDTFAGNISNLKRYFLSLTELSEKRYSKSKIFHMLTHEKLIEVLNDLDLVSKLKEPEFNRVKQEEGEINWSLIKEKYGFDIFKEKGDWENVYIREKKGKGVSDDNAIILAGFLADTFRKDDYIPNEYAVFSRILGAALADRVDTYEKLANIIIDGGQDSTMTSYINYLFRNKCKNREYREFNHIRNEAENKDYTLLNFDITLDYSITASNVKDMIHSSMRRFGKEQKGTCMIEQLLIFANEIAKNFKNDLFKPNRYYSISKIPPDLLNSNKKKRIKIGFYRTDFENFETKVEEDIKKVLPPYKREDNLTKHFEKLVV